MKPPGDRTLPYDPFGTGEGPWLCSGCKHGRMLKTMQRPCHHGMDAELGEGWKGTPEEVIHVACFCRNPEFCYESPPPFFVQRVVCCEGFEPR